MTPEEIVPEEAVPEERVPLTAVEAAMADKAEQLIGMVEQLNENVIESNSHIVESNQRIAESNQRIAELGRYSQRNRRLLRALAVSFLFDILLTGGLAYNQRQTHDATQAAARAASEAHALAVANEKAAIATCISSNGVRANDIALWTHILTLTGSSSRTPQVQGQINKILAFVDKTFAPKVCQ